MAYNVAAELFTEWAVGLVIIAIRLYARWATRKGNFWWDDFCLGLVVIFWTFHTFFLYYCNDVHGSNIGLNATTAMEVPDSQVPTLRKGSIYAFIAWLSYIFMAWSFKGVLMFLYTQLTMGLWQHRVATAVSVFCVATFLASLFFHLFSCYPVNRSWQIKPYAGDNCTIRPLNYIIIETLSIVTDIGIISVPLPLVLKARIPIGQKTLLCVLFSSGIFVMVAAFLRAYYSVKDISTLATALGWASREALLSVVTVCAPGIKPLISNSRWFHTSASRSGTGPSSGTAKSSRPGLLRSGGTQRAFGENADFTTLSTTCERHPYELSNSTGWAMTKKSRRDSSAESQKRIIASDETLDTGGLHKDKDGILVTTDMTLSEETHSDQPSNPSSHRRKV